MNEPPPPSWTAPNVQGRELSAVTDPTELRQLVEFLYGLLDWIDTADDMAKGNDREYRKLAQFYQSRRHKWITSDGQNILVKPKPSDLG